MNATGIFATDINEVAHQVALDEWCKFGYKDTPAFRRCVLTRLRGLSEGSQVVFTDIMLVGDAGPGGGTSFFVEWHYDRSKDTEKEEGR